MDTTLKLYKEIGIANQTKREPFPGTGDNHAWISDYKYSATRMGDAPTISATLLWRECLDEIWTDGVFVNFKGERYYLKNTPSSKLVNSSSMFSHTLEFVSERSVLTSVYFLDASNTNSSDPDIAQGNSVPNNSEFSFSGDVHVFADKINRSLISSGIGGTAGYEVIVDDDVETESKLFSASDQFISDALKSAYDLYEVPFYYIGKKIHFGNYHRRIDHTFEYGATNSLLSIDKNNSNDAIINRITGYGSDRNIPYYYPNPTPKGKVYLDTNAPGKYEISDMDKFINNIELNKRVQYSYGKVVDISAIAVGTNPNDLSVIPSDGFVIQPYKNPQENIVEAIFRVDSDGLVVFRVSATTINNGITVPVMNWCSGASVSSTDMNSTAKVQLNTIDCGVLTAGLYRLTLQTKFYNNSSEEYRVKVSVSANDAGRWMYVSNKKTVDIERSGIAIIGGAPETGDYIEQKMNWRIDVKNNLMPSIYRETLGLDRWYNAVNGKYTDEDGAKIEFENQYSKKHPKEHILSDEEIYPTITGIVNEDNLPIDIFSEIAFDQFDNDEIYPVGDENEGKYKHPYFFAKLRKTNGPNGFNLFEHAIEGQAMSVSFTTGHVASCTFNIGMDEATGTFNPVQVDDNGDLIRDENGDVLCGQGYQGAQPKQPKQQDTVNNEVWIALKKEDSTMGVIQPSAINNIIPYGALDEELYGKIADKFVILGINLPEAYILAAEKRLEDALIKYMLENNKERFTFSLKLSSIFLAEHADIYDTLNENCKVLLKYNDNVYSMYVESYSLTSRASSALPEVVISLSDKIKLSEPILKKIIEATNDGVEKLKKIDSESQNIKVQVLGFASTTSQTLKRIEGVEALLSSVDLEKLSEQVNNNTNEILTHTEMLKSVPVLENRISVIENKINVAVIQ